MYDFRIRVQFLNELGRNAIIQLGTFQCSYVSFLEPWQINLSSPEVYSKPCKTTKMVLFAKEIKGQKLVTVFVKHSIFRCLTGF